MTERKRRKLEEKEAKLKEAMGEGYYAEYKELEEMEALKKGPSSSWEILGKSHMQSGIMLGEGDIANMSDSNREYLSGRFFGVLVGSLGLTILAHYIYTAVLGREDFGFEVWIGAFVGLYILATILYRIPVIGHILFVADIFVRGIGAGVLSAFACDLILFRYSDHKVVGSALMVAFIVFYIAKNAILGWDYYQNNQLDL